MADQYHKVVQKRGQPLREGFTIAKVRAAPLMVRRSREMRMHVLALLNH